MAGEEDDSQKTEEPTQKKLEEARRKGDIPLSREVNNWFMLLAGTLVLTLMGGPMMTDLAMMLKSVLAGAHLAEVDDGGIQIALQNTLWETLKVLAFPMMIMVVIAFIGPFGQVGPLFAPENIKPKLEKISPIAGFKRLFSMRSLMEFAKGILKIGLVAIVIVVIIYPYFDRLEHFIDVPTLFVMTEIKSLVIKVMIGVLVVVFVIAMVDLVFQRQQHHKKMKMSRQEIKDEYKQTEGDPHVRSRLRQLRSEKARQRMMQNVPHADVVITNPTHYAIALKYDPQKMAAPECVAKGVDEVALRIREVAKEHKIEIVENKPLARALFDAVDLDEVIPTEYFHAVAEIISYVFKRKGKVPGRR